MMYNQKNITSAFIVFICLQFLLGCGISSKRDIYNWYPIGKPVTKETLKECKQILIDEGSLILFVRMPPYRWNVYDYHLLFYDNNLMLQGASYFPSSKVEFIKDNVITGELPKRRDWGKWQYRNDLPKQYQLDFFESNTHMVEGYDNKIIEKMEIFSDSLMVKLYVLKSQNRFQNTSYAIVDSAFIQKFPLKDTISVPISRLLFNYSDNLITLFGMNDKGVSTEDRMMVINDEIFEQFYEELFNQIYLINSK